MNVKNLLLALTKYTWLIFPLLLVAGICLRFYKLGEIPVSLYWDEVAMLVDARSVADTGRDMYGNSALQSMFISYGDYKLPVYIWLASLSVQLFGTNSWALRLPSAIAGTMQIVALFVLAIELLAWQFKEKLQSDTLQKMYAISAAFVLAFAPWSILFSRTGFEGHLGQFLVTVSVIFLLKARQKKYFYIPAVIIGAVAVYCYYSVRFVWPVLLLGISVIDLLQSMYDYPSFHVLKQKAFQNKLAFLTPIFALVIWIVLLIPLSQSSYYAPSQQFRLSTKSILNVFDLPLQSNIYREWTGNTIFSRVFYHRHWLLIKELFNNYAEHMGFRFIFLEGDSNLRHSTYAVGLFVFGYIPVFVIGFFALFRQYWKIWCLLCIWWLIALLPASVPEEIPHALRSLNALTPLTLIIAFGIVVIVNHVIRENVSAWKRYVATLLFIFILLQTTLFIHDYFSHYPIRSAKDWQGGYEELATYIHQEKGKYRQIIIEGGDGRLYLWFLAFGNYTGHDIQNFQYKDYSLFQLEQIEFRAVDWQNTVFWKHPTLVVVQHDQLPDSFTPDKVIYDPTGTPRFDIVTVE